MNLEEKYNQYLDYFNSELNKCLDEYTLDLPEVLGESMKYAVKDGGKRVRPVFLLATGEILGLKKEELINFAISLECIHSYSLVHDDLPAMDNDDYRRGKLSTHKKFGEEYGILCGDALLNFGTEIALNKKNISILDAEALKVLFSLTGAKGMILGQVLDLYAESEDNFSEKLLMDIYINKTSKLLIAPLLIASTLANKKFYDELYNFGLNFGIMFQITDDILDVEGSLESIGKTPHKDAEENKLTAIKIYGLDKAKALAKDYFDKCLFYLDKIPNSDFLKEFALKIYKRKN